MNKEIKTIRLIYPDYVGGGLETYYFGAELMQHIVPPNEKQPVVRVSIRPPDGRARSVEGGMYGREEVVAGVVDAMEKISAEEPDRIITIGGNCLVSQAPFDYLHGKYPDAGIVWVDAHPDVSSPADGYPNAHAMVLGSLLGRGDGALAGLLRNPRFGAQDVLYVGLQGLHDYQRRLLDDLGVQYKVQTHEFVPDSEIRAFAARHPHVLVHFDVDVLDERLFHSTYFANPQLVGDGSGGGRMTTEKLLDVLEAVQASSEVVGFTVAEYLPFDEKRLRDVLSRVKLFTE